MRERKRNAHDERDLQKSLVAYLKFNKIIYISTQSENLFSFLNRDMAIRIAAIQKSMGKQKGIPDLIIFTKNKMPLFLELKSGKNKATKEQRSWMEILNGIGCRVEISSDFNDSIKIITDYLHDKTFIQNI